jgi:hypothetical protein
MMRANLLGVGLIVAALAAGCGEKPAASSGGADKGKGAGGAKKDADHAPHGAGPNGGVVFDLGKDHAEFTVDHGKKECVVLFLAGDNKDAKPLAVAAKEFTLSTKETKTKEGKAVPPMTIKLLPADAKDGKATKFVGTDPGLGNVADFEGAVTGEINGKPASGEFKE